MASTSIRTSPFMELPGELRNRIYRAAFRDERPKITSNKFPEPALLVVCKQIRKEAGPIYYAEREFNYVLNDYESTPWMTWTLKMHAVFKEFKVDLEGYLDILSEKPNWTNLLTWFRRTHVYGLRLQSTLYPNDITETTIDAMFAVVYRLQHLPWSEVKQVLDYHHNILLLIDDGWVQDSDE